MVQLDLEQRQSARFSRPFVVTDHEDTQFSEPFEGFDVNLTGLSFWIDDVDLFFPEQLVSLRIKNLDTDEVYCLEGVEVIHQREQEQKILCGCHIAQVTSSQLLAHHRLVMTDAQTALVSMQTTDVSEFNFLEDGSPLSTDQADFQEASMALNLAVSQLESSRDWGGRLLQDMQLALDSNDSAEDKLSELRHQINDFILYYQQMGETSIALAMLAKLLAHTPSAPADKQAWKTLISDFENRFLSIEQQIAYDFMHQGLDPSEALKIAREYAEDA